MLAQRQFFVCIVFSNAQVHCPLNGYFAASSTASTIPPPPLPRRLCMLSKLQALQRLACRELNRKKGPFSFYNRTNFSEVHFFSTFLSLFSSSSSGFIDDATISYTFLNTCLSNKTELLQSEAMQLNPLFLLSNFLFSMLSSHCSALKSNYGQAIFVKRMNCHVQSIVFLCT